MDKYILKNQNDEIINLTKQKNIDLAIQYFSIIKNLKREELLKIYKVEKL